MDYTYFQEVLQGAKQSHLRGEAFSRVYSQVLRAKGQRDAAKREREERTFVIEVSPQTFEEFLRREGEDTWAAFQAAPFGRVCLQTLIPDETTAFQFADGKLSLAPRLDKNVSAKSPEEISWCAELVTAIISTLEAIQLDDTLSFADNTLGAAHLSHYRVSFWSLETTLDIVPILQKLTRDLGENDAERAQAFSKGFAAWAAALANSKFLGKTEKP